MSNLRRLVVTLCLTSVLAVTAFAGETPAPPCAPNPGETNAPPCSSAQMTNDASDAGQTETPPASDSSNTADVVSFAEETLLQFLIF